MRFAVIAVPLAACHSETEIQNLELNGSSVESCDFVDLEHYICIENLADDPTDTFEVVWFVGPETGSDVVKDVAPGMVITSSHEGLFCVLQEDLTIANVLGPNFLENEKYLCASTDSNW